MKTVKIIRQLPVLMALALFFHGHLFPARGNDGPEKRKLTSVSMLRVNPAAFVSIEQANQQARSDIEELQGLGPDGANWIKLNEQLNIDASQSVVDQIISLSPTVFPDLNNQKLTRKIYYYLPGKYYLSWDQTNGYLVRFYFKGKTGANDNNKIQIDFWLTPGAEKKDYQLLKKLIQIHEGVSKSELIRLPGEYDLKLQLGAHEIPEDQITISGIDTDTGKIHVIVETDVVTKQMLEDQLKGLGWTATLTIKPKSCSSEAKTVSDQIRLINIKLCDPEAFTQKDWLRESGDFSRFANEYNFPVKLKHLYFLRQKSNTEMKVYGYDLGAVTVSSGQTAKIRNQAVSTILADSNTLKAWYDFSPVRSSQYLDQVMTVITGGVGDVPVKTLNLVLVNGKELFKKYGIYEISLLVRSIYFDPQGKKEIDKKYKLNDSAAETAGDPLYIPAKAGDSGGSLCKYKLTVVNKNAEIFQDSSFQDGREGEDTIYIGENQIKKLLGISAQSSASPATTTPETATTTGDSTAAQELKIAQIVPASAAEGAPFTLNIYGAGFAQGCKIFVEVNINAGTQNAPSYSFKEVAGTWVDETELQVKFETGFSADPSERKIYVQNPDSTASNKVKLKIE